MESNASNETEAQAAAFYCGVPPSLPPEVPVAVNIIQGVIALLIIVFSLLLNSLLLVLVVKYKKLRERQFYLALQITASHIVFSITVLVTVCVTSFAEEWILGDVVCQIVGPLHDMWVAQRFFFTLVLTLDRAFTLFLPFHYGPHSKKVSIFMSLVAWFFTVNRVSVVMKFGLDCYTYVPSFKTCTAVNCSDACQVFILTYSALFILSGAVLPFLIYLVVFSKAKKARRSIRRLSITPLGGLEDRQRVQQANTERDRRAMVTILILFCALIGCTIPPYTMYTVQFALPKEDGPYPVLLILQVLIGRTCLNLLTVIDPLVIMRNRDVRDITEKLRRKYFKCVTTVEKESEYSATTRICSNGHPSGNSVFSRRESTFSRSSDGNGSKEEPPDRYYFTEDSNECKSELE